MEYIIRGLFLFMLFCIIGASFLFGLKRGFREARANPYIEAAPYLNYRAAYAWILSSFSVILFVFVMFPW